MRLIWARQANVYLNLFASNVLKVGYSNLKSKVIEMISKSIEIGLKRIAVKFCIEPCISFRDPSVGRFTFLCAPVHWVDGKMMRCSGGSKEVACMWKTKTCNNYSEIGIQLIYYSSNCCVNCSNFGLPDCEQEMYNNFSIFIS